MKECLSSINKREKTKTPFRDVLEFYFVKIVNLEEETKMAQRPQKRQRLLISGSYHKTLGEKVARTLSAQLTICDLTKMANGETMVNIEV